MTKTIALLGSTGSIGRQTLEVVRELKLRVAALAAGSSVDMLEAQAREFHPRLAVLYDAAAAEVLRQRLRDTDIEVLSGPEGLLAAAQAQEADTVVTAVVGSVGLEPTLAAIRLGRRIALANKETLVCAGELVMAEAQTYGADIVPVDSEHSAIFQCLQGCADRGEIRRLILTCSGGPFFGKRYDELESMTPADALKHPNWNMGAKITIDSATLMNKGLEVIEAMRLYGLPLAQVEAVVHRQSVIHSLVEFRDGAMLAQLGTPAHPLRHDVAASGGIAGETAGPALLRGADLRAHRPGRLPLLRHCAAVRRRGRHRLRHHERRQRGGGVGVSAGGKFLQRHPPHGGGGAGSRGGEIPAKPCGYTGSRPSCPGSGAGGTVTIKER